MNVSKGFSRDSDNKIKPTFIPHSPPPKAMLNNIHTINVMSATPRDEEIFGNIWLRSFCCCAKDVIVAF